MKNLLVGCLILLAGCKSVSKKEIDAVLWLHNGAPPEMCGADEATSPYPLLWKYGFYRVLNTGKYEFISFCNPRALDWFGVEKNDLNRLLKKAGLPQK